MKPSNLMIFIYYTKGYGFLQCIHNHFLKCLFWWGHDTDFSDPENYLLKWLLTLGVLQYGTSSLWCTYLLSIEGGVWNIINVINKKKSPVDIKTAVKLVNFSGYALPQGIYVLMILGTFFLFCTWIVIYYSPAPKERGVCCYIQEE